jgi:hypothetical protein
LPVAPAVEMRSMTAATRMTRQARTRLANVNGNPSDSQVGRAPKAAVASAGRFATPVATPRAGA